MSGSMTLLQQSFLSPRCHAIRSSTFSMAKWASTAKQQSQKFSIFRYNPESAEPPSFQHFQLDLNSTGPMVLDALLKIKNELDPKLSFRRSCREGICGSCAMNIDGKNGLACLTPIDSKRNEIVIRPLPHMFVLRDLIPDMTAFYRHYEEIQPWLQRKDEPRGDSEIPQSIEERKKIDGTYECILCACCTTSCPSHWWNPETFLGPQALLSAARWVQDSRDEATDERLAVLNDTMKLYRCHNIQNCMNSCPKSLKPNLAIEILKKKIEERFDSDWVEKAAKSNTVECGKKNDPSAVIEQAVSDIVNKHSYCRQQHTEFEKYLQYNLEDEHLSLCDEKIKILKKTLFYRTASNVQTKDFDIFAVSWDVGDLTEPPDDISPLLPPETWGEPDIIFIGLQRCKPRTAALWSVVINHSMQIYSPSFVPITPEQGIDEIGEHLLFIFLREELVMFVHNYSSVDTNNTQFKSCLAGVRFGFHETSLCFISGRIEDIIPRNGTSDDLDNDKLRSNDGENKELNDIMAWEAYARQRFESLLTHVEFTLDEGNTVSASEHPFIIWTGLKDYHERSRREALSVTCSILAKRQSQDADCTDAIVDEHFRNITTLSNHQLDVRYSPVTLVGPPKSVFFTSTVNNLYRINTGSVSVIKAGMMRLVLELMDKTGQLSPNESTAELMLLRHAIPVINQQRMDELFHKTLAALRKPEPQGFSPNVSIDPPIIHIKEPFKPWHSFVTSVQIKNTSGDYPLPIPFEIRCLSNNHNLLMREKFENAAFREGGLLNICEITDYDTARVMPASARGDTSFRSTFGLELSRTLKANEGCAAAGGTDNSPNTHRKKGGWKKFAGKNLSPAWLIQTSRTTGNSKKSNIGYDYLPAEEGKSKGKRKKGGLMSGFLGNKKEVTSPSGKRRDDEAVQVDYHSLNRQASGQTELDCKTLLDVDENPKPFNLTRWLSVEPQAGVILPGESVTIAVQIFIQEPVSEIIESPDPLVLVIRMPDIKRDYFVAIDAPTILPSFYGLDIELLSSKGASPIRTQLPINFTDDTSSHSPVESGNIYPMPKELWHLLRFIRAKIVCDSVAKHASIPPSWRSSSIEEDPCDFCLPLFLQRAGGSVGHMMPRLRHEMDLVLSCVEEHKQIPPEVTIDAALMVLSLWAQSIENSIIPREYVAELSDEITHEHGDNSHLVCRATLLSLPTSSRNFCLTLASVFKELIRYYFKCTVPELQTTDISCKNQVPPSPGAKNGRNKVITANNSNSQAYLMEAFSMWVASFLIKDSPSRVGVKFVKHLLSLDNLRESESSNRDPAIEQQAAN